MLCLRFVSAQVGDISDGSFAGPCPGISLRVIDDPAYPLNLLTTDPVTAKHRLWGLQSAALSCAAED